MFQLIKNFGFSLLIFLSISSCKKGDLNSLSTKNANVLISQKEVDITISNWYLDQFEAIEILAKILETPIDYGSKIENSPDRLLSIQKASIDLVRAKNYDANLMPWVELQKNILGNLIQSLKVEKLTMPTVDDKPASEQGLVFLKCQIDIIDGFSCERPN